jgi:pyridoxal 5'-phosphate synthase pdxT subunit
VKIGVLALQGAFVEHIRALKAVGAQAVAVRKPEELSELDGLIIPGGESTTMVKLARHYGLLAPIKQMARAGKPLMGTCAGLILLAARICDSELETLALMDMNVRRNAFGRQVDSFETDLGIPAIGKEPFHAVFIRAPFIVSLGPDVEALASLDDGTVVAAREDNLLALAFHPELGHDTRLHKYFLDMSK